jgi:cell wall assembly regulator SMI1
VNRFGDVGDPVSESDVEAVEERIGFRLPDELRRHYLRVNGGRPERSYFLRDDHDFELQRFMTLSDLAERHRFYAMDYCLEPDKATTKVTGSLAAFVDGMVTEDEMYDELDED